MVETDTKGLVLAALEQHRGQSISGEELASALGLSRNAVWKAIRDLREAGYRISAMPRRGYCLEPENDLLSVQGIRPFLSPAASFCADRIHVFPSLVSTNRTAKEMALADAEHGTVVLSELQTGGRGRYDRAFFSPAGGLYMSLVLRPEYLPFSGSTLVTTFVGLAVCEAIEEVTGKHPGIKWVNDLLLDGKKICGILTEAVTDFESGRLSWIVAGIGINIHSAPEDFPPELQNTAASVDPEREIPGIRNRLSAAILNRILGAEPFPEQSDLLERYRKRLIMLGRNVLVSRAGESWPAVALDLDPEGRLILQRENGDLLSLSSGEISISI